MAGCDCALGFVKDNANLPIRQWINHSIRFLLMVARTDSSPERLRWFLNRKPVEIAGKKLTVIQGAVRADHKRVALTVFTDHIDRLSGCHAEAAALTDRIMVQTLMPANNASVLIQDVSSGICLSCPAPDKSGIVSVGDKADILTVTFFGADEMMCFR